MQNKKGSLMYEGKAKRIFSVEGDDSLVWMEFKDSMTAFNAVKKAEMDDKGVINRNIATFIFKYLTKNNITTHWLESLGERDMVCKKVEIIPLEVVVRNTLAGSTAKKFAIEEGTPLKKPLVEFYYKKDELNDPFISDDQIMVLDICDNYETLENLKTQALVINTLLFDLFDKINIKLIDFKLEFGMDPSGNIILSDEISPDSCRLWDKTTNEKMDKDRFRRDLGGVMEAYQGILDRLTSIKEQVL